MNELIARLVGGDLMYVLVLAVVFGAVLALLFGVRYLLASRTDVVKDRLARTVGGGQAAAFEPAPTSGGAPSLLQTALGGIARVARPTDPNELGRLRQRLSWAGFRGERAMAVYLGVKVLLCLALGGLFLWFNTTRPSPFRYAAFYTVLAMTLGFYLPTIWLAGRVKERVAKINHALPDALDLLVTCVEAGLGIDAALNRVAEELRLSAPLLSGELSQAALEMRAGMNRGEAFRRLAARTGVEELRNLAAMIVQTEIFGTSIAKSLRVQSEAMRVRRMQIAEERAATVAVKLTVPLIFCILPALFAVLMGPAVVRIFRIMLPKLMGE